MAGIELVPGTPAWVDLGSPDVAASTRFYTRLFDWEADVQTAPEAGGYTILKSNGKRVAGLGPLMNPQQPPSWTTYVNVADAGASAERAKEAGGQVLVEPMQVLDQGKMAIVQDPTGAVVALWEPEEHRGADAYNEPGALTWNELSTRDVPAAKQFYHDLFGWDPQTHGEGPEAYTEWYLDGKSIGGMMQMSPEVPPMVPSNWLAYFAVADIAGTVQKAKDLGGSVMVGPITIPQGTFAVLADPSGATFAAIQSN